MPLKLIITGAGNLKLHNMQVGATKNASPFSKLGQVLREKARGDFERVFKGTEKTRQKLSVVDELLTYWNIDEADDQLEELEDALICVDFGPKTAFKITDEIRDKILKGVTVGCTRLTDLSHLRIHLRRFVVNLVHHAARMCVNSLRSGVGHLQANLTPSRCMVRSRMT
jgi:signal recognition particle GTPase